MSLKNSNQNDNQSISLYIGHNACYVGSHILNLRDQIIVDSEVYNYNDDTNNNDKNEYHDINAIYRTSKGKRYPRAMFFDYKDNIRYKTTTSSIHNEQTGLKNSSWGGAVSTIFRQDNKISNIEDTDINETTFDERKVTTWTNFLNPNKLLSNSICPLPLWTNSSNFDTYCAGAMNEHISPSVKESFMDNFRYFAEECDYLSTVNICCDISDGFGYLTQLLLEEIREETRSATIPVWMLQSSDSVTKTYELQQKKNMIQELSTPICYSTISEYATMVVPINHTKAMYSMLPKERNMFTHFESSALIGTAIDTVTSVEYLKNPHTGEGSKWKSIHNLCQGATALGRFQFTGLEIALPFSASSTAESSELLWESFFKEKYMNSSNLNPFTLSLSSAALVSSSVSFASTEERRFSRFTNMLSIRGSCNPQLIPTLYKHYPQQSYLLSNVQVLESTIHLPMKFPQYIWNYIENKSIEYSSITNSANDMIDRIMVNGCPCAASVGCNETMGIHINDIAKQWTVHVPSSSHQVFFLIIINLCYYF